MEKSNLLNELREEFLRLYTLKEELVSNRIHSAYVLYADLIGRDEFEVFNLEIRVKALKMKIKMAQAYLNRNENPDMCAIEKRIAQLWQEHEEKLARMMEGIKCADNSVLISADVVADCKAIYRMLVKNLHPDLHPELSEELSDMLIVAQAAYKQWDVKTLRQLSIKYFLLIDSDKPNGDYDENQMITRLQEQIDTLGQEIAKRESEFPLSYWERLHNQEWVAEQQNLMQQRQEELKTKIDKMENIVALYFD